MKSITIDFSRVPVFVDDSLLLLVLSLALLILTLGFLVLYLLSPDTSPDDGGITSFSYGVSFSSLLNSGLNHWRFAIIGDILLGLLIPLESLFHYCGLQCYNGQGFP